MRKTRKLKDALIIKTVGSVLENAGFNFSLFNSQLKVV